MAIDEAQLIRQTITTRARGRARAAGHAGHAGAHREPEGGRPHVSAARSSEEIRASIEANRAALGLAVQRLQGEVDQGHRLARAVQQAP